MVLIEALRMYFLLFLILITIYYCENKVYKVEENLCKLYRSQEAKPFPRFVKIQRRAKNSKIFALQFYLLSWSNDKSTELRRTVI